MAATFHLAATLPDFEAVDVEGIPARINALLEEARAVVARITEQGGEDWDRLWLPLEEQADALDRVWSPLRHLHAVRDSEALRQAYEAVLPEWTRYHTELGRSEERRVGKERTRRYDRQC